MVVVIIAHTVCEVGIRHTKFLSLFVHHGNKLILAPGNMLCKHYAGIVSGGDDNGLCKITHRHFLAGFQPNHRAVHTVCMSGADGGIGET